MRTANICFDLILLIVCGWLFWLTFSFTTLFTQDGIGPSYFPRLILIVLMMTTLVDLFKSFFIEKKRFLPPEAKSLVVRLILFSSVIALFITLMEGIPFIINASVSLFLLSLIINISVLPAIITSVALSVTVYFIFTAGFNVIL
ncbi:tripartite tricarboxylate transporter TctB family protein [Bacillaceae bacterium SIJ1]|uniref:tripartite tricarboxylate transporter TctB family protein n=1 Tax=Litoribacterium kuwaitense TaxID=1398745 RepID=UPI0013EE3748|nr:tripartite tricarboxylate transporter TctB family protein [Litoribacterium kuwaitense]NGP45755.1 tripartite tricarboxylate transporter TctB family protein [Litoribacterium kuwaitense]